jgi:peptide/nickel transport system permease protein
MPGSTPASAMRETAHDTGSAGILPAWSAGVSPAGVVLRFARRQPLGAASGVVIVLMALAALLAEAIAPHDPLETSFLLMLRPPGADFLLGTDQFGRDIWSRILYGSRTALLVGFSVSGLGTIGGLIIGASSAYFGGKTDLLLQRLMDILLAFPLVILAIAVVAVVGTGVTNVIIAITIPVIPRVARVVRSSALALRETAYVEAARAIGAGHARIIGRHMVPNLMAPTLIMLTAYLGQAILLEASLSFLGMGVAEPTPAWGLMLRGAGMQFLERAPWLAIAPGVAISLAVIAFNLLGDSLRDALDPRLRTV